MDKPINPEIQERIRTLCKRITVAHDLDAEIQEELYGHMEDKLLAYLAGEEKISEEDAYMLVRRHFGDASALKVLLQDVHDRSVRASLARRLTAALVAAASISIVAGLMQKAALVGLALWAVQSDALLVFPDGSLCIQLATGLVTASMLWYLLVRWQGQLTQGQRPWFVRWSARWMWAATAAALAAPQLIPGLLPSVFDRAQPPAFGYFFLAFLATAVSVPLLLNACAWLWWSDRPPRASKGLLAASVAWASAQSFFALCPKLVPIMIIAMDPTSISGKPVETLAQGSFFGTSLQWSLVWFDAMLANQGGFYEALLRRAEASIAVMTITALLAWMVYWTLRFMSARIAKRNVRRHVIA